MKLTSQEHEVVKQLLEKIELNEETECWVWQGAKNASGHAKVWRDKDHQIYVHRWMYERYIGPIPKGMYLHHICENPSCINPEHLEPITPKAHMKFHVGRGSRRRGMK